MTIDMDKEIRPMSRGGRSSCGNRMSDTKTSSFDNNIKSFNNTAKSDLFLNFNTNLSEQVNILTFDENDNNNDNNNDSNNNKMGRTMSISEMRKLQMNNNDKGDEWEINDNKKIKSSKSVNNKEKENVNK